LKIKKTTEKKVFVKRERSVPTRIVGGLKKE
jgi:hypothetical protein